MTTPAVRLHNATLRYGDRVLWEGLDLQLVPGEFLAVLGPNGSGKTSLLRVLLGLQRLSAGSVEIAGGPVRRGNQHVGYVPQQRSIDSTTAIRGRDLVALGLDGHRWGLRLTRLGDRRQKVMQALAEVSASHYAELPIGLLSGGEQQRLRIAQAIVGNPRILLCDEPLLSLDLTHQRLVTELIAAQCKRTEAAVLFVTHEINPILAVADRVLYLVDGRFHIGTPDEVMTSETLSKLYRTKVHVLRMAGRIVVINAPDESVGTGNDPQHHVETSL